MSAFTPRRLLVTGGAGFLGSHFVDHWLTQEPQAHVVVLDALTYAGDRNYLEQADGPRLDFVHGDILDSDLALQLITDHDLDSVVHFAAETHVDRSLHDPDVFVTSNVLGTQRLLEASRRAWLPKRALAHRFHMVSTDEVYGELHSGESAWKEGQAYAPNSPYSASKAAADHLVRAYARSFGLQVSWSHSCNAYGPRQYPEKLIPVALNAWLNGKPAPLYAGGRQVREWMYAADQSAGVAKILQRGQAGRAYHLGGSHACENIELLRSLWQQFELAWNQNKKLPNHFGNCLLLQDGISFEDVIQTVDDRLGHDQAYALDGSRALKELDYSPQIRMGDGLAQTVSWYLKNWVQRPLATE